MKFGLKIIIPVACIMALLVVLVLGVVYARATREMQQDAVQRLQTADSVLRQFQTFRLEELNRITETYVFDPRFRAVVQLQEKGTMDFLLAEIMKEASFDVAAVFDADGRLFASARHMPELDEDWLNRFHQALVSTGSPDLTGMIFDAGAHAVEAVEQVIRVGGTVYGSLIVARHIDESTMFEYRALTGCDVMFSAGGQRLIRTLEVDLPDQTAGISAGNGPLRTDAVIDEQRYVMRQGMFDDRIQYTLLFSLEPSLAGLAETQTLLGLIGFFAVMIGVVCTWLILTRVTRPLVDLRAGAESIGKGDFSGAIPIQSRDELGQLARAFNEMAVSLAASRAALEETVTTLRDTRARLVQSEKLSAVGEFISGVAHELNNPLTVLVGYAQYLQESKLPASYRDDVQLIADAAERSHKIVQNLLSFARQKRPERKPVHLHDIIDDVIQFMHYELKTGNVEVIRQFGDDIPRVNADAQQLQQVVMNLVNNARQAIEDDRGEGTIDIITDTSGDTVRLTIRDNGPGIPEEMKSRIFDPFFTTKKEGRGTGLGLSVSFGIVKEHDGTIQMHSRVGEGTTFEIELPAVATADGDRHDRNDVKPSRAYRKGLRALVVDDEPAILKLIADMLKRSSIYADTATNGNDALRLAGDHDYDVVLCDWKMPGMSGQEFYRAISAVRACPFLFMTGDVLNDRMKSFMESEKTRIISKPFTIDEFHRALELEVGGGTG